MKGELLVCGGDDGFVRVFDRRSRAFLEKLAHTGGTIQKFSFVIPYETIAFIRASTGANGCGMQ